MLDSLCSLLPNFSSSLGLCRAIRSKHLSSSRLMTQLEISECMGHIWINKQIKHINKPEQHKSRMNQQQQQTGYIRATKTTKMFPITITCLHINKMKNRPAKSVLLPSIYPSGVNKTLSQTWSFIEVVLFLSLTSIGFGTGLDWMSIAVKIQLKLVVLKNTLRLPKMQMNDCRWEQI